MPIYLDGRRVVGDVTRDIARLEALVADLKAIADGRLPKSDDLASAPLIDHWQLAAREIACLVGFSTDHPLLNGPVITTSDLWVHAPDLGWARTLSRFYRLGRSFGQEPSS